MDIKEYIQSQHWIIKMGIGALMIYGIFTIMKWTGLGILTSLQMLSYTMVVGVLFLLAVNLLKEGAVDSFFAWIDTVFSFFKDSFAAAMDKAREDLKDTKAS